MQLTVDQSVFGSGELPPLFDGRFGILQGLLYQSTLRLLLLILWNYTGIVRVIKLCDEIID
jgi:hypothetical protein